MWYRGWSSYLSLSDRIYTAFWDPRTLRKTFYFSTSFKITEYSFLVQTIFKALSYCRIQTSYWVGSASRWPWVNSLAGSILWVSSVKPTRGITVTRKATWAWLDNLSPWTQRWCCCFSVTNAPLFVCFIGACVAGVQPDPVWLRCDWRPLITLEVLVCSALWSMHIWFLCIFIFYIYFWASLYWFASHAMLLFFWWDKQSM